jgi:hypothetical protein
MMGTEVVPEASVIFNQLTQLIAREDFIKAMPCLYNCEAFLSKNASVYAYLRPSINVRVEGRKLNGFF